MESKIIISPSLLSANFANLERDIKAVEGSGADWLHIDVMDGHFVPNITIGACVVKSIRKITNLTLDVHLMIENPGKYIPDFAKAGADIITFHYEATKERTQETIDLIKSFNIKAGLSIKPKTKSDEIFKYLDELDLVLVMTVEPGFGGQKFMEDCALKIPEIKKYGNKDLIIEVDGGINDKTAKVVTNFGANALVAGNFIFNSDNIAERISLIKNL